MKRAVIKVGSQVLCGSDGELNVKVLAGLAAQIADLAAADWQIVLVSSGAVAAGAGVLRTESGARRLGSIGDPVTRKQVLAATGQVRLMETWGRFLGERNVAVAQVLATRSDFQTRRHYLNMRACIEALLQAGVVPVVNENDVVAVTELMFTDNDELAGLLSAMLNADLLCLLSTVPGVLAGDGQPIATWDEQRHQLEELVVEGTSTLGRGGMHSKISIARKAAGLGIDVVIADGAAQDVLRNIVRGDDLGTRFASRRDTSPAKRWLATAAQSTTTGSVVVNDGAAAVLRDRNRLASLLPVGVETVSGTFEKGDVIEIRDTQGSVLGCGRTRYGHEKARELQGQRGQKALIHYDYLYLSD
ncbi:glutamate 5-kinase [Elongatibacter sediminis]|uniref:Glutamate 5-kinase n=1 Tax=Elongatibacter sediminis TaxID=3119006 RepID=A0AAW9RJ89_9GAMM